MGQRGSVGAGRLLLGQLYDEALNCEESWGDELRTALRNAISQYELLVSRVSVACEESWDDELRVVLGNAIGQYAVLIPTAFTGKRP